MEQRELVDKVFMEYQAKLDSGLSLCDLGSCQYATLQYTAEWALELMEILGIEKFEELLGITYDKKYTDLSQVEGFLKEEMDTLDWLSLEGDTSFEALLKAQYAEYLDDYYDGRLSIPAAMEICRDQAWDLWSALPSMFEGLVIEKQLVNVPTYGPRLNQLLQSDNYEDGIRLAYLLYYFGKGNNPLTMLDFTGFDT
jgi:hypothetical protein